MEKEKKPDKNDKKEKKDKKLDKKNSLSQLWEQAVGLIIRPQRAVYNVELLGPREFEVLQRPFERLDFSIKNKRGLQLECSWYRQVRPQQPMPAIVYLHGNSGCRCDADDALLTMLPFGVSVFTFDFSGSGQSGGDFVSLGVFEKDDVATVVEYLRSQSDFVSTIGLWGRSTATAILYAAEDPSVAGMVLDSPFADLVQLCEEVAQQSPVKVPKPLLKSVGLPLLRKSIQKRAGFDIGQCAPLRLVERCFVPALFCHGAEDAFIVPRHSEQLHAAYAGEKNRILVEGGHNTVRPSFMRDSASIFFAQCLGLDVAERPDDFVLPVGLQALELRQERLANDLPSWGAAEAAEEAEMAAAIAASLQEAEEGEER